MRYPPAFFAQAQRKGLELPRRLAGKLDTPRRLGPNGLKREHLLFGSLSFQDFWHATFLLERIRESENEFSAKLAKIWHDLWAKYCVTLRTSKTKDRFVVHNGNVYGAGISIDSLNT